MATKSILSTAWFAYGNKMGTILKNKHNLVTQILIFTHVVVFFWSLTGIKKTQKQFIPLKKKKMVKAQQLSSKKKSSKQFYEDSKQCVTFYGCLCY